MSSEEIPPPRSAKSLGVRALDVVERVGNRLPDPALLFVFGLLAVWVTSLALSGFRFSIPGAEGEVERVVSNQLAPKELVRFLVEMPATFTGFPPLGMVLVALLGVGVAERSGLVAAVLRSMVAVTPDRLLTPMIVFVGCVAHTASDAGYVLVVPLAGAVFHACGRHPLAGICAAFAGVAGGFAANPLPSGIDPLLQGLTQAAVGLLDPQRAVNPLCNWYFTASSSILITLLGWWVTDTVVEKRLLALPVNVEQGVRAPTVSGNGPEAARQRLDEGTNRRAMIAALLVALVGVGTVVASSLPPTSALRGASGALTDVDAPLMKSIVPLIFLLFLAPGVTYGLIAGSFRSAKDVVDSMSVTMSSMGYYLVMSFCAAQFIAAFNHSQLGALLAVRGAQGLAALGLPIPATLVGTVVLAATVNLVIGSSSAKWALLAPILVPMLMQVGISPEATQAAYRVGDSITNPVTPLMVYFPLVVTFCQRWRSDTGIGTLCALMLPYSIAFAIAWVAYFLLFYALGLPLGLQGGFVL